MENNIMTATVIYCNELAPIMSIGLWGPLIEASQCSPTEYMSGDIKASQSNTKTVALTIKELR